MQVPPVGRRSARPYWADLDARQSVPGPGREGSGPCVASDSPSTTFGRAVESCWCVSIQRRMSSSILASPAACAIRAAFSAVATAISSRPATRLWR